MARSDARENRERLMAVARASFVESGTISLNRIAQEAGVGPGTLYRHFPTREALVLAVYRQDVEDLVADAPRLRERLGAVEALRAWTTELVAAMRLKHGLGDALAPALAETVNEETYGPVIGAITLLLDAGKAEGSIRPDADPADFLLLTGALWRAGDGTDGRPARMLALVIDGLRAS